MLFSSAWGEERQSWKTATGRVPGKSVTDHRATNGAKSAETRPRSERGSAGRWNGTDGIHPHPGTRNPVHRPIISSFTRIKRRPRRTNRAIQLDRMKRYRHMFHVFCLSAQLSFVPHMFNKKPRFRFGE